MGGAGGVLETRNDFGEEKLECVSMHYVLHYVL